MFSSWARVTATIVVTISCVCVGVWGIPALAQKTQKKSATPATIKDVLITYQEKVTSLGILKRVAGDYFVLDDDGTTLMHPLSAIHTLKIERDEEENTELLVIRLLAY
jgi:hypothetical protein